VYDVVRFEADHGYVEIRRERNPAGDFLGHFHTWDQTSSARHHNTGPLKVNNPRKLNDQLTELAYYAGFTGAIGYGPDEQAAALQAQADFVDTLLHAINVLTEIHNLEIANDD
jgi:hypothetical protein